MATYGNECVTFNDYIKTRNPDGSIARMINVIQQTNPVLQDIKWMAGNLPTGNQTTQVTGLPNVYLRRINRGVPASKGSTKQITDTCCNIEGRSQIDLALLKIQKDPQSFTKNQDDLFLQAMGQKVASMIFYGDSTKNMDEFNGLAARYAKMSDEKYSYGNQIVSAGGTGTGKLSSAWLIGWGENSAVGIYPENGKAGMDTNDLGITNCFDPDGNQYLGHVSIFNWTPGLAVVNPRMCACVRNIDTSAFADMTSEEKRTVLDKIIEAKNKIMNLNLAHMVWYVPEKVYTFLDQYLIDKNNVHVTKQTLADSTEVLRLGGIEVKKEDALLDTEDAVL